PRELLVAAAYLGGAGAGEDLGDLDSVQIAADRNRVLRADRVEDREDLVLLDELAGQLQRPRGVVAVVAVQVLELASMDAAAGIDVLEVGVRGWADGAEGRGLAAERDGAADQDLGAGDSWSFGRAAACCRNEENERRRRDEDEPRHREIGFRSTGRTSWPGPSEIFAPAGIGRPRESRLCGSWARELEARVSVSVEPRGISVASSIIRIVSVCEPLIPEVLTPPSLTTIVLPRRGFAVSTATRRDQPPESFALTRMRAEPKVSTRVRKRPLVRSPLPRPGNESRPGNATVTFRDAGSFLK